MGHSYIKRQNSNWVTIMEESLWVFFRRSSLWVKLKLSALLSIAACVLFVSAFAIFQILKWKMENTPKPVQRELSVKTNPAFTYVFELKNLSIPLVNRASTRIAYAQFALELDCPSDESKKLMELNRAKTMDRIFEVASQFYVEDFDSVETGSDQFKKRLLALLEKDFKTLSPRQVVFKDWLIN